MHLTRSSSTLSKASLKSKEILLKLLHNTTKANLLVEQADEQAKSKLDLIRTRKELEEADTLNTQIDAKEQLKVVHIFNDTDSVNN